MIKIYTSYFYQIRFFPQYLVPLSTAIWDPAWFHQNQKQDHIWKDKNGVYNGLRAEVFAPGPLCEGLCRGPEFCATGSPQDCLFLKAYRFQLDQLDFNDIVNRCERMGKYVQSLEHFRHDPEIALIVHEAPQNPCSERRVIQEWFAANGIEVKEWSKDEI